MKRNLLVILIILSMISSASSVFAAEILVKVNGESVSFFDAKPFIDENDRTQVPVRAIAESIGFNVSWNEETKTVSIYSDTLSCDFIIGSPTATVKHKENNGDNSYSVINMDTEALIAADRTYIPAAYLAQALSMKAEWDAQSQTVTMRPFTDEELSKPFASDVNMPAWLFAEGYEEGSVPKHLTNALSNSNVLNGNGFPLDTETDYINSIDISDKVFKMPFSFYWKDTEDENTYIESPVFDKCKNIAVKAEIDSDPVWLTISVWGIGENGDSFFKNTRKWHAFMVDKSATVDFNDLDPTLKYYVQVKYTYQYTPKITNVNGTVSVATY